MNAAKRLKKLLDSGENSAQLDVLKTLVIALHQKQAFDLSLLYTIDYPCFQIALQLLDDWRLGQHLDTRSKLMERLFGMYPDLLFPTTPSVVEHPTTEHGGPAPSTTATAKERIGNGLSAQLPSGSF